MKERPILFIAPMVRATLDGSNSQTRRIVKCNHDRTEADRKCGGDDFYVFEHAGDDCDGCEYGCGGRNIECPYGTNGDHLWVKETFSFGRTTHGEITHTKFRKTRWGNEPVIYRANKIINDDQFTWKPSIFMPRWASRITLEITAIRVERLQDISESDAEAEGVDFMRHIPDADETLTARVLYKILWESINGEGSWNANPWVWVLEFKRLNQPVS